MWSFLVKCKECGNPISIKPQEEGKEVRCSHPSCWNRQKAIRPTPEPLKRKLWRVWNHYYSPGWFVFIIFLAVPGIVVGTALNLLFTLEDTFPYMLLVALA